MKLSQSSLLAIETAVTKAVHKFTEHNGQTAVTDIHLQPNQNTGELSIYDDEDSVLSQTTIKEWCSYEDDDFYGNTEQILTVLLNEMKDKGAFDKVGILKPYSFVLVDEEKETIADLLLMDDDTLLINDELLKGLDEELDAFLKDLLEK